MVPIYSPALQQAMQRAWDVTAELSARDDSRPVLETRFLLCAMAENPTSEAGRVLTALGFNPAEAWDTLEREWRGDSAHEMHVYGLSRLLTHLVRRAGRRSRRRGRRVVTTGMVLRVYVKRRCGDLDPLRHAGVTRRTVRRAIKAEMRARRAMRWGIETPTHVATYREAVQADRFDSLVCPPPWFFRRRRRRARRREEAALRALPQPARDFAYERPLGARTA